MQVEAGNAMKFDGGKPRMSLIERCFIEGVARVLTFGAKKYAARNYRNGALVSRYLDAALRHLVAFGDGENNDIESGESHLHHAACCLMMADWMHRNRPDLDDRASVPAVVTVGVDLGVGESKAVVHARPSVVAMPGGFSNKNKMEMQQCQSSK